MHEQLKDKLPQPVMRLVRDERDFVNRIPEMPAAYLHPWRRESIKRIKSFKNKFPNQRCFIIGNGPSLRNTNLKKLKNEFTFGMNRIYLMFPELGFDTSYYVAVNDLVVEQCAADIQALEDAAFCLLAGTQMAKTG